MSDQMIHSTDPIERLRALVRTTATAARTASADVQAIPDGALTGPVMEAHVRHIVVSQESILEVLDAVMIMVSMLRDGETIPRELPQLQPRPRLSIVPPPDGDAA